MVGLERGTVKLEPYQESWRGLYEEEVERLEEIAGDRIRNFEHIGSTAIEGVPAKPIIDFLATVESLDVARDLQPLFENNGYEFRGNAGVEGRLFFAKGPHTNRTHYLSIVESASDFSQEKIAFRDFLRGHPDAAEEYASLKRELAAEYPNDRDRYTEGKGSFIQNILDRAFEE